MSWLDKLIQRVVEDKEIDQDSKQKLLQGIQTSKQEFETMEKEEHKNPIESNKTNIKHEVLDQKMTTLFSEFREHGDQEALMYELVEILKNGDISKDELEALAILFRTGDLKEIEQKRSGFSKKLNMFIDKAQGILEKLFGEILQSLDDKGEKKLNQLLKKLKADHVEIDIVKV